MEFNPIVNIDPEQPWKIEIAKSVYIEENHICPWYNVIIIKLLDLYIDNNKKFPDNKQINHKTLKIKIIKDYVLFEDNNLKCYFLKILSDLIERIEISKKNFTYILDDSKFYYLHNSSKDKIYELYQIVEKLEI